MSVKVAKLSDGRECEAAHGAQQPCKAGEGLCTDTLYNCSHATVSSYAPPRHGGRGACTKEIAHNQVCRKYHHDHLSHSGRKEKEVP